MATAEFLHKLAKELKLQNPLGTKDPKIFCFQLDPKTKIYLQELEEGSYLICPLLPLPPQAHEELFTHLMVANLLGHMTFGSALGLSENSKEVLLCRLIDYSIDYQEFKSIFEDFANMCKYWQDKVLNPS